MVQLIIILLAAGLLQGGILPFNLVLIIILARSFAVRTSTNLYLAFALGLWVAFLTGSPLGGLSFLYLVLVFLIQVISDIHLFAHWSGIIPVSFVLLSVSQVVTGMLSGASLLSSFNLWPVVVEAILVLPAYIAVCFWEERFMPRAEMRLKIGR